MFPDSYVPPGVRAAQQRMIFDQFEADIATIGNIVIPQLASIGLPELELGLLFRGTSVVADAAETVPQTIGEIIGDAHPDTMIHITIASEDSLASGVDAGSIFVRYGDVAHMTIPEYQATVVGAGAAGNTSDVVAFVVSKPGAAQFVPWYESGSAGVAEHASVAPIIPDKYIPLPP